jgi:Cu-Zn family superoxide dismutase
MNVGIKVVCFSLCLSGSVFATQISIPIHNLKSGAKLGDVVAKDTAYGLLLTPHLNDLPPGAHGFHIHSNASCGHQGADAGAHLDPDKTGSHQGPYGEGHLGDLPVLVVNASGQALLPVLAPRLTVSAIINHSLMIHVGADNYTDSPANGGGGDRLACGVIARAND